METKMNEVSTARLAMTLFAVMCASTAGAQQPLDTQDLAATRVQAASCADVEWETNLLAQYPRIAEGCQEVIGANGRQWARFEAELLRSNPNGTVTLNFKNREGRSLETLTLMPVDGQRVAIGSRQYRFSELEAGQTLSLYVPEGIFAVAAEVGAPTEQLAQIVREPVQLAQAQPAPQPAAQPAQPRQTLPQTAGALPLVALAGLLSAFGGVGLGIRRRLLAAKK
jgi:hypothetical protein